MLEYRMMLSEKLFLFLLFEVETWVRSLDWEDPLEKGKAT